MMSYSHSLKYQNDKLIYLLFYFHVDHSIITE